MSKLFGGIRSLVPGFAALVLLLGAACAAPAAPAPTAAPAAKSAAPTAAPAKPAATTPPARATAAVPVATAAAAITAAPAQAAKPASGDPYKLGVTFPLSGPQAAWGTIIVPIMEIAVQDINAAGGVNGRPLSLVVEDSKGDPQAAVSAMRKVVQVDRVPVVLTIFTNVVTAQIPLAEQLKTPIISTVESPGLAGKSEWNFVNSVLLTDTLPLLSQHWKNKGVKKLFAFIPNTAIAEFGSPLIKQEMQKLGVQYEEAQFKLGETDYRGLIARAKDFSPDAIFVWGHGTVDEAVIMRQVRELGIQAPLYAGCGCPTVKSYREALGEVGEGLIFGSLKYDKQAAAKVISAYKERLGFEPDYAAIEWYDIVHMTAEAIKRNGYTGDGIRQGLAGIKDFPSIGGGQLSFDETGQTQQQVALYQMKGQEIVEIQP